MGGAAVSALFPPCLHLCPPHASTSVPSLPSCLCAPTARPTGCFTWRLSGVGCFLKAKPIHPPRLGAGLGPACAESAEDREGVGAWRGQLSFADKTGAQGVPQACGQDAELELLRVWTPLGLGPLSPGCHPRTFGVWLSRLSGLSWVRASASLGKAQALGVLTWVCGCLGATTWG